MSHAATDKATLEFLNEPTVARYLALQQRAFSATIYDPRATALVEIEASLRDANPAILLRKVQALPELYQICPRLHYVEGRIRESLGEVERMHGSIGRLKDCLRVIGETGDGTRAAPFAVTFMTDIDDLVRSAGEKIRYQQPVATGDRQLDVVTAHTGVEFWFDVSRMVERIPSPLSPQSA